MKKEIVVCLIACAAVAGCKKMEGKPEGQVAQQPMPAQQQMPVQQAPMQQPMQAPPVSAKSPEEISVLKEVLRKHPDNVSGWINLGNMLMDTSNFKEAIDAYTKALQLDPKNVNVRVDMGTCYRGIGRPDKAIDEYQKAIQIDPTHPNAHKNLGIVLAFDLKNKTAAIKAFENYLRIAKNDPDVFKIQQMIAELKAAK